MTVRFTPDFVKLELLTYPITLSSSIFYKATFNVADTTNPLEGAEVIVNNQKLLTNTKGIAFLELHNGEYPFTINAQGFKSFHDTLIIDNENVIKNISLHPQNYPLTFYVYDGGDQPINHAEIVIQKDTLTTDENGFVTFNLNNGIYSYTITTNEYGTKSGEIKINGRAKTLDVVFEKEYMVTFRVIEGSEPIEGASIELNEQRLLTNAEGEANIVLGNGKYIYKVTANNYQSFKKILIVAYSDITEEVTLSPFTYVVTFMVTDGNNPVEGATITIDDSELTTGEAGKDSIKLADGEYEYTVTAEDYEDFTNSLTVSGADIDEEITLTATGIDQVESHEIKIYPNPASVIVFIETQGVNSVELVNIEGKVVIEKEVNDAITMLNIDQINAGIYFLHLFLDNGKRHTEKILIH